MRQPYQAPGNNIIRSVAFFHAFAYGQRYGIYDGPALAPRPRRQTVKRRAPQKTWAGDDHVVKKDFHALAGRHVSWTGQQPPPYPLPSFPAVQLRPAARIPPALR